MTDPPALPRRSALLLWLVAGVVPLVLVAFAAYQASELGWHPAREREPRFSAFHWFRMWVTFGLGALTVGTLMAAGQEASGAPAPLSRPARGLAWATAAAAAAATVLFVADPVAFHALTIEDGAIEWTSALLLFAAAGFMLLSLASHRSAPHRWLETAGVLGLAGLFFLMAMEEISWFQRVIGFETPDGMAERNWQGEFNLHNFQTDLTELALYSGTGIFLVLLPLVRETVADWRALARVRNLLPDRAAAAVGAPMLLFTYGHWNLLPVQFAFWAGLGACTVFALRAGRQGRHGESHLFAALAILLVVGQTIFLLLGDRSVAIYDSTEYREWFIALGLAVYGWRQWRPSHSEAWK